MGNYVFCALSASSGHWSSGVKVIFPGSEVRQLSAPTKAVELMLETPNFFLVNSHSLHIGRRFSALNADEDLEAANVYVMFPMKRLNSLVTVADIGQLFLAASSASKQVSGGRVRILPESLSGIHKAEVLPPRAVVNNIDNTKEIASLTSSPKMSLDEIEGYSDAEFRHRLSMSRSKKPLLETIVEEPVAPRRMQHYIIRKSFKL